MNPNIEFSIKTAQAYSAMTARGLLSQKSAALMPQSRARKYSHAHGKLSPLALVKGFRLRPSRHPPWAESPQPL